MQFFFLCPNFTFQPRICNKNSLCKRPPFQWLSTSKFKRITHLATSPPSPPSPRATFFSKPPIIISFICHFRTQMRCWRHFQLCYIIYAVITGSCDVTTTRQIGIIKPSRGAGGEMRVPAFWLVGGRSNYKVGRIFLTLQPFITPRARVFYGVKCKGCNERFMGKVDKEGLCCVPQIIYLTEF